MKSILRCQATAIETSDGVWSVFVTGEGDEEATCYEVAADSEAAAALEGLRRYVKEQADKPEEGPP